MRKRIIVLEVCGNAIEPHECNGICEQAHLYGIEVVCKQIKSNEELESAISINGQFDYIYLSAHGCADSFGSEDGRVDMSWSHLSLLLCEKGCMKDDSILLLSCCRGGLKQVAYSIFSSCSQINYILGPRQSLTPEDMHICFGVFLYNVEVKGLDPVVACERIKLATDQRFSCYDRQEEELNLSYYNFMMAPDVIE